MSRGKSLRTTNALENPNREFRRRTKTQGSFATEAYARNEIPQQEGHILFSRFAVSLGVRRRASLLIEVYLTALSFRPPAEIPPGIRGGRLV